MKLSNKQHIELLDAFICKHTDYQIDEFTGGSVSNTLTHSNTQIHYKVNLYFGYKNKRPITKTIEINEDIYTIMYKAISLKVKSLIKKEDKLDMNSLMDLMEFTPSSTPSSDTPPPTLTNTNYLPTIDTLNTNTIESDFNLFWEHYPKKKSKEAARKSFTKYYKELPKLEDLINIVEMNKQTNDWIKDNGQYIPMASTWLNNKRWMDELTPPDSNKVGYLLENNIFDLIEQQQQGVINE